MAGKTKGPNPIYKTYEEMREASRRRQREYYQRNKERIKQSQKERYHRDKDKVKGADVDEKKN